MQTKKEYRTSRYEQFVFVNAEKIGNFVDHVYDYILGIVCHGFYQDDFALFDAYQIFEIVFGQSRILFEYFFDETFSLNENFTNKKVVFNV